MPQPRIQIVRSRRVVLLPDAARFLGVSKGRVLDALRKHEECFPPELVIKLSAREAASLSPSRPGRRLMPKEAYAFSAAGIVMLCALLSSKRAAAVRLCIARNLARSRQALVTAAEALDHFQNLIESEDSAGLALLVDSLF